jgi:hypothetical protein
MICHKCAFSEQKDEHGYIMHCHSPFDGKMPGSAFSCVGFQRRLLFRIEHAKGIRYERLTAYKAPVYFKWYFRKLKRICDLVVMYRVRTPI